MLPLSAARCTLSLLFLVRKGLLMLGLYKYFPGFFLALKFVGNYYYEYFIKCGVVACFPAALILLPRFVVHNAS